MDKLNAERLELWLQYRGGDKKALDKLCESFRPLVLWVVAQFYAPSETKDDLIDEAWVGMLEAVENFDPERGGITVHVTKGMRRHMMDVVSRGFQSSHAARKVFFNLGKVEKALLAEGIEPSNDNVAARLGVRTYHVERARAVYAPLDDDYLDESESPDTKLELEDLAAAIESLPERERTVIEDVHLKERSMERVAKTMGLSPSRVQQLSAKALEHLREEMAA